MKKTFFNTLHILSEHLFGGKQLFLQSLFIQNIFLILLIFSTNCISQSISNRWIGTWASIDGTSIQFTNSQVIVNKNEIYQWVDTPPKLSGKKTAFYYGTFKKSDYKDFSPSDSQSKKTLSNISNDTLRQIFTTDCWDCGSGDAADFYILDKVNIYLIYLDYSSGNMHIKTFLQNNQQDMKRQKCLGLGLTPGSVDFQQCMK